MIKKALPGVLFLYITRTHAVKGKGNRMAEAFKIIETQEALNAIIKERLEREKAKYADYDQIKATLTALQAEKGTLESSLKSVQDQLKEVQTNLTAESAKSKRLELESLRTRIAVETGLPVALRDRLQGEDEASLKADAAALSELVGKPAPPLRINEPEGKDEKTQALKNMVKNLNGGE